MKCKYCIKVGEYIEKHYTQEGWRYCPICGEEYVISKTFIEKLPLRNMDDVEARGKINEVIDYINSKS